MCGSLTYLNKLCYKEMKKCFKEAKLFLLLHGEAAEDKE